MGDDLIAELRAARSQYERQAAEMAALADALLIEKERVEAANRAKSELITVLSHEFRTPLTAVLGFCHIAETGLEAGADSDALRDNIRCIREAGKHLLDLVNDLLDMAKIEAGGYVLNEDAFAISEAIDAVLNMLGQKARDCGVRLIRDVRDPTVSLRADRRLTKQLFTNLVSNAIKFTPDGGAVTVGAWCREDGNFVIQVADNGIGMSAEEIATALQPFGQIDSDQGRRHKGTGLGLPLAKSLVELHGGTLEVASSRGTGTAITAVLPGDRLLP